MAEKETQVINSWLLLEQPASLWADHRSDPGKTGRESGHPSLSDVKGKTLI